METGQIETVLVDERLGAPIDSENGSVSNAEGQEDAYDPENGLFISQLVSVEEYADPDVEPTLEDAGLRAPIHKDELKDPGVQIPLDRDKQPSDDQLTLNLGFTPNATQRQNGRDVMKRMASEVVSPSEVSPLTHGQDITVYVAQQARAHQGRSSAF